jgi:hypothetical protein
MLPTMEPVKKPPWRKIMLFPSWVAHSLSFFSIAMLVAYPIAVATPHSKAHWSTFALIVVFAVGYGLLASRQIRRTILSFDENGYTIRLERVRRRMHATPSDAIDTPTIETTAKPTSDLSASYERAFESARSSQFPRRPSDSDTTEDSKSPRRRRLRPNRRRPQCHQVKAAYQRS